MRMLFVFELLKKQKIRIKEVNERLDIHEKWNSDVIYLPDLIILVN